MLKFWFFKHFKCQIWQNFGYFVFQSSEFVEYWFLRCFKGKNVFTFWLFKGLEVKMCQNLGFLM